MSSMSEQLLKAGLVTKEQVNKAAEKPNKKHVKKPVAKHKKHKLKSKVSREQSDLEKFYKLRSSEENKEKQQALKKKQEAALRKKEMNKKINKLISNNIKNDENAEIRYNFVVGTTIKYLFVTELQQEQLANGELAITFHGGKRCLIPTGVGKQILEINPQKILVVNDMSKPGF